MGPVEQKRIDAMAQRVYAQMTPEDQQKRWSKVKPEDRATFIEISASIQRDPDFWRRLIDPDPAVTAHISEINREALRPVDEQDRGTPEARAKRERKRRTDVLEGLVEKNRVQGDQIRAAQEIRDVWEALTRRSEAAAIDPGKEPVDTSMGDFLPPLAQIPAHLANAVHQRYLPWCREAQKQPVGRTAFTLHDIARWVLIENLGPWQIEERQNMRRGRTALKALQRALTLYVEVAGWQRPQDAESRS